MTKFNDPKLNNGFPENTTAKDYPVLTVVDVMWNDSPNTLMIITEMERHAHNYKGIYSFRGIMLNSPNDGDQSFDSDQIAGIHLGSHDAINRLISLCCAL